MPNVNQAAEEIQRLISEYKGELIRDGKHLVYRFPDGKTFVLPKTSSDFKSPLACLTTLRHLLGLVGKDSSLETQQELTTLGEALSSALTEPAPPPAPPKSPMRLRIESKIDELEGQKKDIESRMERIRQKAQEEIRELEGSRVKVEESIDRIAKLFVLVDDPEMEETLSMLLGPNRSRSSSPAKVGLSKDERTCQFCGKAFKSKGIHIHLESCGRKHRLATEKVNPEESEKMIVTKQYVLAATQTFEDTFSTRDVIDLMVGDKKLPQVEEDRVKQAISQLMVSLHSEGKVIEVQRGWGRRPTTWRKVDLTHLKGKR